MPGYMDHYGWLKYMSHFSSMCFYYPLNTQVLFYDEHIRYVENSKFNILWFHHIQAFIRKVGDSVPDHINNNGSNLKLNNMYGYARMK